MDQRRSKRIRRIEKRLSRKSLPRVLMTLIVLFAAFSAFLTSFTLLRLGVWKMAVRYPIAVIIAYLVFLVLLAAWLWLQRRSIDPNLELLDLAPTDFSHTHDQGVGYAPTAEIGSVGGTSGVNESSTAAVASSDSPGLSAGFNFDFEELALIVLVIVAVIGGLVASLYVIYIAPALLAEILVDGAVFAGLYRRVRGIEEKHWLPTAIRRTALPALLVAFFFGLAGYLMQRMMPESHTIGEFWKSLNS